MRWIRRARRTSASGDSRGDSLDDAGATVTPSATGPRVRGLAGVRDGPLRAGDGPPPKGWWPASPAQGALRPRPTSPGKETRGLPCGAGRRGVAGVSVTTGEDAAEDRRRQLALLTELREVEYWCRL